MSKKMIADMPFTYARKDMKPGDEFEANEDDAFALRVYRRAHPADETQEPKKTRVKRTYKRRDLTAESP
jgi:hypothetical protein